MPRQVGRKQLGALPINGCVCGLIGMSVQTLILFSFLSHPLMSSHYPTTKFTAVSDTPENLRLKKQTAQQSEVSHAPQATPT